MVSRLDVEPVYGYATATATAMSASATRTRTTTTTRVRLDGFDFKTKFHKNPQLATTYGQKAPIAQYVRRIYSQIAVRFCAICSIYIMPKALGDISTVSILI